MQIDVYLITGRAVHIFRCGWVDVSLELKRMGYSVWDDYSHHRFKIHKSTKSEDLSLRRHLIKSSKCVLVYDYKHALSSSIIYDLGVAIEYEKPIIVVGDLDGISMEKALNVKKMLPWVTVENWGKMVKLIESVCGRQNPTSAVKRVNRKSPLQHPDDPIPMQSKRTGRWGYCDKEGRTCCQYKYDSTYLFSNGMGRVSLNGKYGYLGQNARETIPPQYAFARDFNCGLAPVAYMLCSMEDKLRWGYIDKENNLVVPYVFDDADVFESCGLARVKVGDKYGIIDTIGNLVLPAEYDSVQIEGISNNNPGLIKKDEKYGIVNDKGEIIVAPQYEMTNVFSEGLTVCQEGKRLMTIDYEGKRLVDLGFDKAKYFSEGLLPVACRRKHTEDQYLWGFCNKEGSEVIACEYEDVLPFSEGYAAACFCGKWGFIDHENRVVIPFQYDIVGDIEHTGGLFGQFAEGIACAVVDGRYVLFNKFGQEFWDDDLMITTPMYERGWLINWEIFPFDYPTEAAILRRSGICPEEYYITNILAALIQHRLKEHPEERLCNPITRQ